MCLSGRTFESECSVLSAPCHVRTSVFPAGGRIVQAAILEQRAGAHQTPHLSRQHLDIAVPSLQICKPKAFCSVAIAQNAVLYSSSTGALRQLPRDNPEAVQILTILRQCKLCLSSKKVLRGLEANVLPWTSQLVAIPLCDTLCKSRTTFPFSGFMHQVESSL